MDMTLVLIVLVVLVASRPNVNTFNNCNNIHLDRWCTFTSAKTSQSAMTAILWDRNRFQAVVRLWGYTSSAVRSMGWADGTARPRRRVGSRLNLLSKWIFYEQRKKLAQKYNVEMPIVNAVYDVLYNGLDPKTAVDNLMTRSLKEE